MRPKTRLTHMGTIFATALAFAPVAAPVGLLEGTATVEDGDDLDMNGIDIRLQGIAAPEDNVRKRDPGGPEASANLHRIVDSAGRLPTRRHKEPGAPRGHLLHLWRGHWSAAGRAGFRA